MRALVAMPMALLLAACAAPAGDASHAPAITAIHQGRCDELFQAIPIPMDEARAFAPPGFPPLPFDFGGLSPPLEALATTVTVGYRCDATTGAGLSLGEYSALVAPSEAEGDQRRIAPG